MAFSMAPPRATFTDPSVGIGCLPLTPEETQAERELLQSLPEFQQAADVLLGHGDSDQATAEAQRLPNCKRAAKALPALERTVEICRSSMGFQSVYLQAALRHLVSTLFMQGDYANAARVMQERGDVMQWPVVEHERMLRLLLRANRPHEAAAWCQKDAFTQLFPQDATVPLKWQAYELMGTQLTGGAEDLAKTVKDPLFEQAVATLREKKQAVQEHETQTHRKASEQPLGREIPYLMAQYASLSVVSTRALELEQDGEKKKCRSKKTTDEQLASLQLAETLWQEALTWVESTAADADKDALLACGPDAPFEACVQTNLGEVLLRKEQPEDAMEWLGKAMSTLQAEQSSAGSSALALSRVLGLIARGCHAMGQAVSSEGLYTSVIESFEQEAALTATDRLVFARALRGYGDLLANWDKREGGAQQKYTQAARVEQELLALCQKNESVAALRPVFYLPL